MKTGELRKADRLCLVSLGDDFLSKTFTVGHVGSQEKKREKKKKKHGGASCSRIVVKGIIIESWQQASRQMVFEKEPAAGRGAHSWMNAAFRSCENLFYPKAHRKYWKKKKKRNLHAFC